MKQLICDMCGSNDLIKEDGVFVCQVCGTKYSVEEARRMMVEGTVVIDNSHMIENYYQMAFNAYGSNNQAEAESYCNKIIEIEPGNYKAWMLKGKAAGWQSTIQNPRVLETISAFSRAIENAPDNEREDLVSEAKEEIKNLSVAMLSLRGERFTSWPDDEEAEGFLSDITTILGSVVQFISQTGEDIPVSEIMGPAAKVIDEAVTAACMNKIIPEYEGDTIDPDDKPNKYEWETYVQRLNYCISLLNMAIDLCDDDEEEDIQRYDTMIVLQQRVIGSCSWTFDGYGWRREWQLSPEAIAARKALIRDYEKAIKQIRAEVSRKKKEKKEAEKRKKREGRAVYWKDHPNEKAMLENERIRVSQEIETMKEEIAKQTNAFHQAVMSIPGADRVAYYEARINELTAARANLGVLKVTEKKAFTAQIDQLSAELAQWTQYRGAERQRYENEMARWMNSINERIARFQARENEINAILIGDAPLK